MREKKRQKENIRVEGRGLDFVKETIISLLESPFSSPKFALGAASWSLSIGLTAEKKGGREVSLHSLGPLGYFNSSKPVLVTCPSPKRSLPAQ